MASKALPLLGFLLLSMLLISLAVDAKEEPKATVDQFGGGYPGHGGGYPGRGGGGYPGRGGGGYPGRGGGGYPGRGGGYPYPGRGRPCRFTCCNRYRRYCGCCTKKEFIASTEGHH